MSFAVSAFRSGGLRCYREFFSQALPASVPCGCLAGFSSGQAHSDPQKKGPATHGRTSGRPESLPLYPLPVQELPARV